MNTLGLLGVWVDDDEPSPVVGVACGVKGVVEVDIITRIPIIKIIIPKKKNGK